MQSTFTHQQARSFTQWLEDAVSNSFFYETRMLGVYESWCVPIRYDWYDWDWLMVIPMCERCVFLLFVA
jgi:hypothetical protein